MPSRTEIPAVAVLPGRPRLGEDVPVGDVLAGCSRGHRSTTYGTCGIFAPRMNQYVLADHGRAFGILWYDQPEDLDGITQLAGTWFQDHIAPRLAGPETAIRGRVVVNMPPPKTATA